MRNAYLDLISAIQGLRVAEQNMEIVQTRSPMRGRASKWAPRRRSSSSARKQTWRGIRSRSCWHRRRFRRSEDILRTLILDPSRPDYWQVRIVPTDTVQAEPRQIDLRRGHQARARPTGSTWRSLKREPRNRGHPARVSRDSTRPSVTSTFRTTQSLGIGRTRFRLRRRISATGRHRPCPGLQLGARRHIRCSLSALDRRS